ncbi:hypothetical protein ONS95_005541 [Cadophora gregata]|uniref:uncharacterized protein n=1 Tax=Cadophora gregata TaxID=51156 RepID=UPI0026DB4BA1|nr:uncharacterized protein ONS95_005541 [Cadophora gregata]KAK0103520.1 hypothetical protein ONS95_005541 [Cadophora gregata]KAK0107712.1 hypothetical protein ONS96_003513 [Cadophora gregata f. sp. sojae]
MADQNSHGVGRRSSPIRRIRQACLNCRRKKSKCPGEKPQCSICARLGQRCLYESPESEGRKRKRSPEQSHRHSLAGGEVSKRFGNIEQKLEELAASMQKVVPASNSPKIAATALVDVSNTLRSPKESNGVSEARNNLPLPRSHHPSRQNSTQYLGSEGLPADVIEDGIIAYFTCFHSQPYNLLCRAASLRPNSSLDPVVLNPMLALSIRCSSHEFWEDQSKINDWIRALSDWSWYNLLQRYGEGDTSLEYLQGLCLLAQVDFADGRVQRAHTQISLGVRIAQSLGYLSESTDSENEAKSQEVIRCTWTLFMLDRTFSMARLVSPSQPYQAFQLPKPTWEGALLLDESQRNTNLGTTSKTLSLSNDQDLSALLVGVYSLWDDAIRYVFQTNDKSDMPPWHPTSDLATIEYRFADFEPEFSTHRYREVNFPRRAIQEPHMRPYFASWLCFQLTYMSIQCCIHHPFIMFIKLQHVIRKVPPSFLQKSYKSSLIHSRWIIRFLDEMDEAGMMLHDPFIGYLTAIAATIQLEHTLSKHADVAAAATLSFRSAIRYLKKLSKYWNSITELLGIVEELAARLRHRHTLYYSQDDYDGILPAVESERVGLAGDDMSLMWKVFDYASMSASNGKSSRAQPETFTAGQKDSVAIPSQGQGRPPNDVGIISGREDDWVDVPPNSMTSASLDFQSLPGAQSSLEQLNLSLFDQIPEDWAFTIDDWTLFGAPGSTYFYNESS